MTSTVGLVGAIERVDATLTDPERAAVCGLFPAESVNTRLAVRVPEAEGVKVMVAEQLDEAIKVEPHVLLVIAKSDASAPAIAMRLIVIGEVPLLLNVTDFEELVEPTATFAKVTLAGDTDTLPVLEPVAVPDRATCNGAPFAETLRVAARAPDEPGLKTTPIAQFPTPARLAPHELLATAKSPASGPENPTASSAAEDALLLLSVMVCPTLVLPVLVSGNESAVGLTVTPPATGRLPVPESVTCCGLPLAESETVSVAVRDPAAAGLKIMPMLQVLDPGRLDPQVLPAIEKSAGSVPTRATLSMEIVVVPSLCNVTFWSALSEPTSSAPKESVCGVTVKVLIFPVAVPESATLRDELNPEWLKVRIASRAPGACGVKVIVAVQLEEAARLALQVLLEIAKSPAFVPEIPILLIAIGEVPMLFRVTAFGVPVEPKATLSHARLLGSMRTPATTQPASIRTLRKIEARSKLPARLRPTVLLWFAVRVIVTSSGSFC
ncbi:MAG: hypothetical protein WA815_18950 [Terracidiphilus sp.]